MIVVKIELWPFGKEWDKKLLEEIHIGNKGTGDLVIGNYKYETKQKKKKGKLEGFLRSRGALELVKEVINKMCG